MKQFKSNRIFLDSETVAEQLRSARQIKKIKIEDAAKKLNISRKYLEALEKGDFNKLPAGVYGKSFLREYSFFLGLDYGELERILKKEADAIGNSSQNNLFSRQITKMRYFLAMPKIIKNLVLSIIVIIFFTYLALAVKKIISPPYLFIENPQENFATEKRTVDVIGTAEAETQITINGKQTLIDTNGSFAERVNLKNGINIITIIAKKRYGGEKIIKRQILVKDE